MVVPILVSNIQLHGKCDCNSRFILAQSYILYYLKFIDHPILIFSLFLFRSRQHFCATAPHKKSDYVGFKENLLAEIE